MEHSIEISGTMTLRLDRESSAGPALWLNSRFAGMQWLSLDGEQVADSDLNLRLEQSEVVRMAQARLRQEATLGDEITLRFTAARVSDAQQLLSLSEVALASWVEAWYPISIMESFEADPFTASVLSVPGTTTFELPGGWIAISDGRLMSRERLDGRTVEVWDLGPEPVARSFAAAEYSVAERVVDGRTVGVYLFDDHAIGAGRLSDLVGAILAAQESRLGPFPFPAYSVAEVSNDIEDWDAASQQTFIMATGRNFEHEHGNAPLWAHEMGHAWWGNTVGGAGPGGWIVTEALAQLSVLIALEEVEGLDAMVEFLEFSRDGYSEEQCARGYFALADKGSDHPLSTLSRSDLSFHDRLVLANSKGMWVYHMLRREIGDELFFETLRGLIDEYSGRAMSLDDLREAFISAAPEAGLGLFFSQWLDRPGAPRLDLSWSMLSSEQARVEINQVQSGDPFELDVELELTFEDGSTQRESVTVSGGQSTTVLSVRGEIEEIVLDPDRDLLIWRPSYRAGLKVDLIAWIVAGALACGWAVSKLWR